MRALLACRPSAVFASNDLMARLVLRRSAAAAEEA
jgi:hypothetical protein